ncbi:hypothetical protein Gpo141_00001952 [Globisporangium polare]
MTSKPNLEPSAAAIKVSNNVNNSSNTNEIKTGEWELGLFSCFEHCIPNCCMAWCCTCVSLAQISSRLGVASYALTLLAFFALDGAFYVIYSLYLIEVFQAVQDDDGTVIKVYNSDTERTEFVFTETPAMLMPARIALSAWGLAFVGFTCFLRLKTRARFGIPGNACVDVLASLFCSCCAVAQIASHVKSYTPKSCRFGPVDTLPAYPAQDTTTNTAVSAV